MRKIIIFMVTAIAFGVLTNPTWATKVKSLGGGHTKAQVKADCDAVGGTYADLGGGYYGCDAPESLGGNSVTCHYGYCVGQCGAYNTHYDVARRGGSIVGILHPPLGGFKSGGNAPPRHHDHPMNVGGLPALFGGTKKSGGGSNAVVYHSCGPQHASNEHHFDARYK